MYLPRVKCCFLSSCVSNVFVPGNHFTDKVAKAFAEVFKDNRTLQHLDLSYNEFGELGGLFLGAGLVNLITSCNKFLFTITWESRKFR